MFFYPERLMKNKFLLSAVLILSLTACSKEKAPLKIGLVSTLSGRLSTIGIHSREGFLMAVEEQNAKGGIKGHPIEVYYGDDQGDPAAAVREDERLIREEGISFLFGHSISMFAPTIEELLSRNDVLYFSPTISTTALSGKDDNFIRCMPSQQEQGMTILKILKHLKLEKTSIIYDTKNTGYSDRIMNIVRERATEYGIHIISIIGFDDGPDYTAIVEEAVSSENDSVVLISSGYDAGYLGQFSKKLNPSLQLIGSEWTKAGEIITHGGQSVEGMIFASAKEIEEQNSEFIRYRDAYQKTFKHEPELVSLKAYEGAKILFEGMEKADELTIEGVKQSILSIGEFESLRGKITIDAYGDASSAMGAYILKDGEFVLKYLCKADGLEDCCP